MGTFDLYRIAQRKATWPTDDLPSGYSYAYKVNGTTARFVGQCDLATTKGPYDDSAACGYFILSGNLCKYTSQGYVELQGGGGWTEFCGDYASVYGFGIHSGHLYKIDSDVITQIDSTYGWTALARPDKSEGVSRTYAIRNGALYLVNGASLTQVGSSSSWTQIRGKDKSPYVAATGICGGKLYKVNDGVETQIGSMTGWTKVSGAVTNKFYGIRNGRLYSISGDGDTVLELGSYTDWTDVSGESVIGHAAFGIRGGCLYNIYMDAIARVGTSSTWTAITGNLTNTSNNFYGIDSGRLYHIIGIDNSTTVTQIGSNNDWIYTRGSDAGDLFGANISIRQIS